MSALVKAKQKQIKPTKSSETKAVWDQVRPAKDQRKEVMNLCRNAKILCSTFKWSLLWIDYNWRKDATPVCNTINVRKGLVCKGHPLSEYRQVAIDFQNSMWSKRTSTFEAQVIAKYDRQNGKMIKIGRGNSDIFIEESWGHSMEKMRRSYSLLFVLS